MGKVKSSDRTSSNGTNTMSRKENKTKIDEREYFGKQGKKRQEKVKRKNTKHCRRKEEKNVMKSKRSGATTSVETSIYTIDFLSRVCTETECMCQC